MTFSRIVMFSCFLVLMLFDFGCSQPYANFYGFQIPPTYSGFVMNMNPDGTKTVKYLTDAEAQAMAHQQSQYVQNIMSTNMDFLNNIFSSIPIPKVPVPTFPTLPNFQFFG